ncbi:MAG: 3-dehydroquinate synthase [Acidobacteriota bacterium]
MKTLEIKGNTGNSKIYINKPFTHAEKLLKGKRVIIITDENVGDLYKNKFPPGDVIIIGMGEENKTLRTIEDIYKKLLDLEFDRSGFILGIGGGIVCDITGFVASTYMRGVRFGFISSTLLAQVDASIGGKNGVNFEGYKNMAGTFNQPEFVICDPEMLKTLPEKELKIGFAEIIKHALIGDPKLLEYLEENYKKALLLDPDVIGSITYDALVVKAGIVNADEREKGERRKLNFGHTMAHAFEKTSGLTHGEAVAAGMGIAAKFSMRLAGFSGKEEKRVYEILKKFDLNRNIKFSCNEIKEAVRKDKKKEGDHIYFILLKNIGEGIIERIPLTVLEGLIDDMC